MIYTVLPLQDECLEQVKNAVSKLRQTLLQVTGGRHPYRIIAINDGASKEILSYLQSLKDDDLIIRSHYVTMGMGAVLANGLVTAWQDSKSADDIVIIMEPSHVHDIFLFQNFIAGINNGSDIVIASRYKDSGSYINFPLMRQIFSRSVNCLMKKSFPIQCVSDYTLFLRAYRAAVLNKAIQYFGKLGLVQAKGYVSNTEILIKLSLFSHKTSEIPFTYDLSKNKMRGQIKVFSTINEYFVIINYLNRILLKIKNSRNR